MLTRCAAPQKHLIRKLKIRNYDTVLMGYKEHIKDETRTIEDFFENKIT